MSICHNKKDTVVSQPAERQIEPILVLLSPRLKELIFIQDPNIKGGKASYGQLAQSHSH